MAFAVPLLAAAAAGGGAAAAGGGLATALGAGSAALGGLSAFQQSAYQAKVAKNNAEIAAMNAERAGQAAQVEQLRSDRSYAQAEGTMRAQQSASGLSSLGRSQLAAIDQLRRVRGEAALDIRHQGDENVRKLYQEAADFRSEASAAKRQAIFDLAGTALDIGSAGAKDPVLKRKFNSLIGGSRSTRIG